MLTQAKTKLWKARFIKDSKFIQGVIDVIDEIILNHEGDKDD